MSQHAEPDTDERLARIMALAAGVIGLASLTAYLVGGGGWGLGVAILVPSALALVALLLQARAAGTTTLLATLGFAGVAIAASPHALVWLAAAAAALSAAKFLGAGVELRR